MAETQSAPDSTSTPLTVRQGAEAFAKLLSPQDHEPTSEPDADATSDAATSPDDPPADDAVTPEAEAAPAGSDDDVVFTLMNDEGKEEPITRAEARNGYARNRAATQKYQAAAELRKQAESEATQYREARTQYAEQVTALRKALELFGPPEPDERLRAENPTAYFEQQLAVRDHRDRLAAAKAEEQRLAGEAAADQQKQFAARLAEEEEKLLLAVPEWKDQAKGRPAVEALTSYAKERGFQDHEVRLIFSDHRSILLLRDAMAYRDLQAKKPDLKKRVEQVKTVAPGAPKAPPPPGQDRVRAVERLSKTGKIRDAAEAFKRLG